MEFCYSRVSVLFVGTIVGMKLFIDYVGCRGGGSG